MILTASSIILFMGGLMIGMVIGLAMERQARDWYIKRDRERERRQ